MSWGWVMAIIAVVMVAMLVGFAFWLWRLLTDIWAEVTVLARRAGQVAELLDTLDLTPLDQAAEIRPRTGDLEWDDDDVRSGSAPSAGIRRADGDEPLSEASVHSPDRGIG